MNAKSRSRFTLIAAALMTVALPTTASAVSAGSSDSEPKSEPFMDRKTCSERRVAARSAIPEMQAPENAQITADANKAVAAQSLATRKTDLEARKADLEIKKAALDASLLTMATVVQSAMESGDGIDPNDDAIAKPSAAALKAKTAYVDAQLAATAADAALRKAEQTMGDAEKAAKEAGPKAMIAASDAPANPDDTKRKVEETAAMKLDQLAADMAGLRKTWDSDLEVTHKPVIWVIPKALLARRGEVADCADVVLGSAVQAKKDAGTGIDAEATYKELQSDYVYIAKKSAFDQPQLSLFLGPSLSLNGDDKFKTGLEVSALFDGGAGSFFGFGRVFTDFTYQTKGSVDVTRDSNGVVSPNADDLFRNDHGYLRFNTGVSSTINDRYSGFVSAGLTTIPGTGGEFPQALRPRYAVGFLARTFVGDNLYTRLSLSVAHDEYWRQPSGPENPAAPPINSYERGVVEALVLIPKLNFAGIQTAGRLTLDTPLDGKGPSEVRLSVLASMDFVDFFNLIRKAAP